MRRIFTYLIILCSISFSGCGESYRRTFSTEGLEPAYIPEYASGFSILKAGQSSTILSIHTPWQGAKEVDMHLFISRNGELPPEGFDGVTVNAPLRDVICMSSSYVAYIDALGEVDAITGVSGIRYITNSKIQTGYDTGEVRDVGYDTYMNYELIAKLDPDIVFIYGLSGENSQLTGKLRELGIKYVYIGDYVEQSPLGKAEWIVAFGEMFDKRVFAGNIFGWVRDSYNSTKNLTAEYMDSLAGLPAHRKHKPVVMLNAPYRDTWYVPGDRSYMVQLLGDAGAEYACAGQDNDLSRPISGESAYIFALKSDIWLNPGQAMTMADVRSLNTKFADIPSVKQGEVFNCNARITADGGSDFWESGAIRPDIVLQDLVRIFYPELMPLHKLYYFRQMR